MSWHPEQELSVEWVGPDQPDLRNNPAGVSALVRLIRAYDRRQAADGKPLFFERELERSSSVRPEGGVR